MSLKDKIEVDYKSALKYKDKAKISTFRLILSSIKDLDISNRSGPNKKDTDDEDIKKLLKKMIKQRSESIEVYKKKLGWVGVFFSYKLSAIDSSLRVFWLVYFVFHRPNINKTVIGVLFRMNQNHEHFPQIQISQCNFTLFRQTFELSMILKPIICWLYF